MSEIIISKGTRTKKILAGEPLTIDLENDVLIFRDQGYEYHMSLTPTQKEEIIKKSQSGLGIKEIVVRPHNENGGCVVLTSPAKYVGKKVIEKYPFSHSVQSNSSYFDLILKY